MTLEYVLVLIVANHVRKTLQTKVKNPEWDKIIVGTNIFCSVMIALQFIVPKSTLVVQWFGHAILWAILYLIVKREEFKVFRTYISMLLPYMIAAFLKDFVQAISLSFYNDWQNYFDNAVNFAFLWMLGFWIVGIRQRKAEEKERLKRLKEEELNRAIAIRKVELEQLVAERTTELTTQKEELQHALTDLKATQTQLIQSEKMASLGELTAGIAHEIQNPLNFVNNFSEVSAEMLDELNEAIENGNKDEVKLLAIDIKQNLEKITHHGKRADAIVKGMLLHSRSRTTQKKLTDINALADEYLRLSYHGLRAKDKSFNATMHTDFDQSLEKINIVPQDIGRVILNLITNAFYSVTEKKKLQQSGYEPTVYVSTKKLDNKVEIKVRDNGLGIPQKVLEKIYQPFFTTKPTGQGTGLGLSLSFDIITKGHGGELKVETKEGEFAEFIILLPITKVSENNDLATSV